MKKFFLLPLNLKNKTEFLIEKTKEVSSQNNFIYITSNFCKVQDFKLKFYKFFKNFSLPLTFTLKSLAIKIIDEKSNKRIISDIEKYLILLEIMKKEKDQFFYPEEWFAKIISNFIKELKISLGNNFEISEIGKIVTNYPWKFERSKINIEKSLYIFEIYQEHLNKNNLIDMEDIYSESSKLLKKNEYNNIIFENILEIPVYQRSFVSSLIKNSENTFIFYLNPNFFSPDTQELIIKDTLNFLNTIENWEKEEVSGNTYNTELKCFNFPTAEEEIKGIKNLIEEELKKNENITFNDFIITCPDILRYRNHIKRIFSRFDIPVEIIPGYSLIKEPSIVSLFEFLKFEETYDWTSLMNILTAPYFIKFNRETTKKFSEYTREKYENIGFFKDDFYKFNDDNINKIKKCIQVIKNGKRKLDDWKNIVKKIIEETGWSPSEVEVKIEFEKILEKLRGNYYLTKESFINLISKILEMVDVEEGKGMGIRISGIIESLGIEKKVCFVCGTTEKNFPNALKIEEFFIPEKLKKEIGLEYFEKRIARDRGDFYRIKNEHEKVIFTYPSKVEEEQQMKSILIFNIDDTQAAERQYIYIKPKELFDVKFDIEKFKNKFMKNGVLEINVTDLEIFLQCPYKFYLKKVEEIEPYKIPEVEEAPDIWGNIIHESFKNTFENEKDIPIKEDKIKDYREKFEYYIIQSINKYLKDNKISRMLGDIFKLRYPEIINKFEEVIKRHIGNSFIGFEEKIETKSGKFKLKGKVDIIEKTNKNHIFIIDIKTGTSINFSYTKHDFFNNHNIQVPLYVWMYSKQNNKKFEDVKGIIWNFSFLEDKKNIEKIFDFTKSTGKYDYRYLDEIEDYLNQISEKIIKGENSFIPENECIYFCEYKEMCIYGK
ncbi:MAG: PD-(D/E)XK nuclease family protein [Candidatus Omnitrophica bacterium]|nr:PD-(D/E)XK nuclease family protein [Candidatus Omnitrophota bacterium]